MNRSKAMTASCALFAILVMAAPVRADVLGAHSPLFLNQAEHAIDGGNATRAIEILAPRVRQLRAAGERNRAHAVLCKAYIEKRDYPSAETACTDATKMRVANWSDFNNRGVLGYLQGDYVTALEFFEQAATLNPQSTTVWQNIVASLGALRSSF